MKMVKSLLLGSAAGLLAMSGAQAADLPVKAKAVEYVRICSLYGAGFWYVPGTDTCMKIGGYLRAEIAVNTNSVYTGNTSGAETSVQNIALKMAAAHAGTEIGLVRSVATDFQAGIRTRDVEESGTIKGADLHVFDRFGLHGKIGCLCPAHDGESRR